MPATEMIVMVAAFSALTLVAVQLLRLAGIAIRHKTVRKVVDRDPAALSGLMDTLGDPPRAAGDERLAVILVALGIAIIVAALIAVDDRGLVRAALGGAAFPLILGAALGLRHHFIERAKRRGGTQ